MSHLRPLLAALAVATLAAPGVFTASVSAQERTSPPRPPGGSSLPSGSYTRTCRGANMNGNILSAQCTGPTGAPVFSSIDTNGCRGRDISNDRGYLRCNTAGPRPPEPPRPVPPRPVPPVPPRPVPPVPPRPVPPQPPIGGNFEAIVYTRANFQGQAMRVRGPMPDVAQYPGFNDNIRSIRVVHGRAQICVDSRYRGRCVTIGGSYRDLNRIGMANRISSIR